MTNTLKSMKQALDKLRTAGPSSEEYSRAAILLRQLGPSARDYVAAFTDINTISDSNKFLPD